MINIIFTPMEKTFIRKSLKKFTEVREDDIASKRIIEILKLINSSPDSEDEVVRLSISQAKILGNAASLIASTLESKILPEYKKRLERAKTEATTTRYTLYISGLLGKIDMLKGLSRKIIRKVEASK